MNPIHVVNYALHDATYNLRELYTPAPGEAVSSDRRKIGGKLLFLDDHKMFRAHLNQAQVSEFVQEDADSRPRRPDHRRQFFLRNPELYGHLSRVFPAELIGELQQCLPK